MADELQRITPDEIDVQPVIRAVDEMIRATEDKLSREALRTVRRVVLSRSFPNCQEPITPNELVSLANFSFNINPEPYIAPLRHYHRAILGSADVDVTRGSVLSDYLAAEFGWWLPHEAEGFTVLMVTILMRAVYRIELARTEGARIQALLRVAAMRKRLDRLELNGRVCFAELRRALHCCVFELPLPMPEEDGLPEGLALEGRARALKVGAGPPGSDGYAPFVTDTKAGLLRHLGWSVDYYAKLDELVDLQAIELKPVENTRLWQMRILKSELACNRIQLRTERKPP